MTNMKTCLIALTWIVGVVMTLADEGLSLKQWETEWKLNIETVSRLYPTLAKDVFHQELQALADNGLTGDAASVLLAGKRAALKTNVLPVSLPGTQAQFDKDIAAFESSPRRLKPTVEELLERKAQDDARITELEVQNQGLSAELARLKAEIAQLRVDEQSQRAVAEKAKQDTYDAQALAQQNYNAAVAAQQARPQVVYVDRPVMASAPVPLPHYPNPITHPTGYEIPGYKDSATQLQEFINQGEQLKIDNAISAIERKLR